VSRPEAELTFLGGIRVDGNLEMPGTVALAPQTIAAITGGKVKPSQAIPINLKLSGPAWNPTVSDLDLKPAVAQIVKEGGAALLGKAFGVDASQAQEAAQKRAGAVQQQAQAEADKAKQQAAEEAQKQELKLRDEAAKKLHGLLGK
jgi:AsmA protein